MILSFLWVLITIMAVFRDHKVGINQLLEVIPEGLLANLSLRTKVDHYAKILHGKKLFYLLMYGILENEKLSQRSLEDTFNDTVFKSLFNLDEDEKVRRSSISERLSKINPEYFKQIYECMSSFQKLIHQRRERSIISYGLIAPW